MGRGANPSLRAVAGLHFTLHFALSYSNDYFRFGRATRAGGGLGLQTSVTRFTEGQTKDLSLSPAAVDLYSMTHVAESRYYEQIARDLEDNYDCVLYELIVPEHVTVRACA